MAHPLLEYVSYHLTVLESVQRRATQFISYNFDLSYPVRLNICNVLLLSYRREILYLNSFFGCYNYCIDFNIFNIVQVIENDFGTRANNDTQLVLQHKLVNKVCNKYILTNSLVTVWIDIKVILTDEECTKPELKIT